VGPTISIRAPIAESQAEKASTANGGTERIACSPRSDRGGGHGASQEDAGDGSGYRYRSGMSADASSSSTTKIRCTAWVTTDVRVGQSSHNVPMPSVAARQN
jgi:hypothetical protein